MGGIANSPTSTHEVPVGQTTRYDCNPGYRLNAQAECLPNKNLSELPVCVAIANDAGDAGTTDDAGDAASVDAGDAASTNDGGGSTCKSADFDGTGAANMKAPDNNVYDFSGPFTIEAWVKSEGAIGLNRALIAGQVVDDMTSSFNSYFIGVNSQLAPMFQLSNGATTPSLVGDPLTPNTWTHIAGIFDGTTAYLYVGGTKVAELSAPVPQAGNGLSIGHSKAGGASNLQFNGKIKDVRLSNVARYTGNTFAPQKSLTADANTVGLFHLDESTANKSPDSSSTANNADVTGTVPFVLDCP